MDPVSILEAWLKPITEPLKELSGQIESLSSVNQGSVNTFDTLVNDLTDPALPNAFTGPAADAVSTMAGEYVTTEAAVANTTTLTTGPIAEAVGASDTMLNGIMDAIFTAGSEVTDTGPLEAVTTTVDVAAGVQGGVDVPNDVAAAGLTGIEALALIGILIQFFGTLFFLWMTWQNVMNDLSNQSYPALPDKPKPVQASMSPQQEIDLETLRREFPDVSADDIKGLLLDGFTPDEIRAMLKAGFTHDQIQDVIRRIRTAQKDQHGTDTLGLTADQIREMVNKVAAAVNSPDEGKQLEGTVALSLIDDLVSFQRQVIDPATGKVIREIDVETSNTIIEVTKGPQRKLEQVLAYKNNKLVNPKGKQVILYAPDYSHAADNVFGSHDIPIIRSLKELFDYLRRL